MSQQYSDEQILNMLQRCYEEHGACTATLLDEKMDDVCSSSLVTRRFGTWSEAKEEAGIDDDAKSRSGRKQMYEDQEILAQIRECARRNDGKLLGCSLLPPQVPLSPWRPRRFRSG